ncbi:MAG: helix-turn-helix transcriptional regulator [Nitrospinae bacterium]|nr:helix-turn-helix transcriptional regulator [Nitrospinota bacterium]
MVEGIKYFRQEGGRIIKRNKEIGLRIKFLREKRGISQSALGEVIGVSYQQIQKYENGTTPVTVERLLQISAVLEADPSEIISPKTVEKVKEEMENYSRRTNTKRFWNNLSKDEAMLLKKYRTITNENLRRSILFQVKTLSSAEKEFKGK